MKTKSLQLNASILRIILSVSLFLIIAGAVAGFVFAHQRLAEYAVDISKKKVDAAASDTTIQSLKTVERQLQENTEVRETADSLRLDDDHPEFIVSKELKDIAARNNITINLTTTTPTTEGGTTPTTPAPQATSGTFNITMDVKPRGKDAFDKTSYKNFLQFLRDLEQNLPKVKVNGVKVGSGSSEDSGSPNQTGSSEGIFVDPINLEIYIKK